MPPQEGVPLPLRGIAVGRPGRESWLPDEVLDTILPRDPEARVYETRFPGVVAVHSSLDAWELARLVSRGYHSFVKRFTPAIAMAEARAPGDVVDLISRLLVGPPGPVRIVASFRGRGKGLAGRALVEEVVRRRGFKPSRRGRMLLLVESLDLLFLGAYGITSTCGPDCITVAPP